MRKIYSYYLTLIATCAMSFAQSDLASVNGVVRDVCIDDVSLTAN